MSTKLPKDPKPSRQDDDSLADLEMPAGARHNDWDKPTETTNEDPKPVWPTHFAADQGTPPPILDEPKPGETMLPLQPLRDPGKPTPLEDAIALRPQRPRTSPPVEGQDRVTTLERQVAALKQQLASQPPRAVAVPRVSKFWVIVTSAAFLVGALFGALLRSPAPRVRELPLMMLTPRNVDSQPVAVGPAIARPEDKKLAEAFLEGSEHDAKARQYEAAISKLKLCIQAAELPECHKRLAAILSWTDDDAANVHYKRYLELTRSLTGSKPSGQ